jgi:hypothetical protein
LTKVLAVFIELTNNPHVKQEATKVGATKIINDRNKKVLAFSQGRPPHEQLLMAVVGWAVSISHPISILHLLSGGGVLPSIPGCFPWLVSPTICGSSPSASGGYYPKASPSSV